MQTFCQSNINCKRTFNAWYLEMQIKAGLKKLDLKMDKNEALEYYNGGYSPKSAILSHLRVPITQDLFS